MKSTRIALVAAGAFLLAACSSGGDHKPDHKQTHHATSEVTAVVDTSKSECHPKTAKKDGNCWLPLYAGFGTGMTVANMGGACTRADERKCWPQPGDKLTVICGEPGSQRARDNTGRSTDVWVSVAIPKSRVVAPGYRPDIDKHGRAIVFVSSLWLRVQSLDRFPLCSDLFNQPSGI